MPIFEYECKSCGNQFELIVRPGSGEPACPKCASTTVERLISLFAVNSPKTVSKNWSSAGADQKKKSKAVEKERSFYTHDDHHH